MGADHGGVEIRAAHLLLNGSDILPALQQMGGERMTEGVAACQFGEARAIYGSLHRLLNQAWIQRATALDIGILIAPAALLS